MNKLYDSLLLKGYSKEAAIFLAEKFPESTAEAIYEVATEGSKEELMELCSRDSYLYDENIGTYLEVTWDYITSIYEVEELLDGTFILMNLI
jgi:hypothetical protein